MNKGVGFKPLFRDGLKIFAGQVEAAKRWKKSDISG